VASCGLRVVGMNDLNDFEKSFISKSLLVVL